MACHCPKCGRVVDCGDEVCALCECASSPQPSVQQTQVNEQVLQEVQPNMFLVRFPDGSTTLKWMPTTAQS